MLQTANSLEKTLMQNKIEDKRRGWQKMKWLASITDSMDMNLNKFQEIVEDRGVWHATVHGVAKIRHDLVSEQQQHTNLFSSEY